MNQGRFHIGTEAQRVSKWNQQTIRFRGYCMSDNMYSVTSIELTLTLAFPGFLPFKLLG